MKFASSTGRTAIARTVRSRSGLNPSMTSPVNWFSATFLSVHPLSQFDCVVSFGLFNPEYGFKKYLLYSRQAAGSRAKRSEEHTSELQSRSDLVCRLLLEKKKKKQYTRTLQSNTVNMSTL